jgi:hypothetical protein
MEVQWSTRYRSKEMFLVFSCFCCESKHKQWRGRCDVRAREVVNALAGPTAFGVVSEVCLE